MYTEVGAWSDVAPPPGAVVVGYNGRSHSRAALEWGAAEAARRYAPLMVLFAANYPGMTVEPGPGILHRDPGALEAAEEVTARGVAEAQRAYSDVLVVGATEVTSPAQALTEASRHALMVVLGSRGYGRIAGALLGSVAFGVSARAASPVVVVKDQAADRLVGPGHRVVVGTDGSAAAAAAVDFAAERAAAGGAELEIISCTGGHQVRDVDEDDLRSASDRIARAAADRARTARPELTITTRIEDCPAEITLIDAAADAGLVVVGTRGRGAFAGMLLGSVSHAVIHGADCAVAVIDEVDRPLQP
jgi:nucleotide-binding universal stress UspA family protein